MCGGGWPGGEGGWGWRGTSSGQTGVDLARGAQGKQRLTHRCATQAAPFSGPALTSPRTHPPPATRCRICRALRTRLDPTEPLHDTKAHHSSGHDCGHRARGTRAPASAPAGSRRSARCSNTPTGFGQAGSAARRLMLSYTTPVRRSMRYRPPCAARCMVDTSGCAAGVRAPGEWASLGQPVHAQAGVGLVHTHCLFTLPHSPLGQCTLSFKQAAPARAARTGPPPNPQPSSQPSHCAQSCPAPVPSAGPPCVLACCRARHHPLGSQGT